MARRRKKRKKPVVERIWVRIRANLISGMVVIVPLGVSAYVIQLFYRLTAGRITPALNRVTEEWPAYLTAGFSVLLLFIVLYGVGLVAAVVVGRRLIALAESIIRRIPLVKGVYGASKQIVETLLSQSEGDGFQSVALVEFPRRGIYSLAFVTGTIEMEGREFYKVFVPTTPNPTSGYFEIMDPSLVRLTGFSVEEGVKILMSGGILAPETIGGESSGITGGSAC